MRKITLAVVGLILLIISISYAANYDSLSVGTLRVNTITGLTSITAEISGTSALIFEGSSDDANETTFSITNPTADRTVTFPDLGGTVILSGHTFTGDVTATLGTGGTTALTVAGDSVALTTDTTGNYVQRVQNGSGISGGSAGSEGADLTLALGALTADWDQTGAFDIKLNNTASELKILGSSGTYYVIFDAGAITSADKTVVFTNVAGTARVSQTAGAVSLTSDNQNVTPGVVNYNKLTSDSGTSTDRTVVLVTTGAIQGEIYVFENGDGNDWELLDSGSAQLSATFTADTAGDTITLIYNGSVFVEISRSDN